MRGEMTTNVSPISTGRPTTDSNLLQGQSGVGVSKNAAPDERFVSVRSLLQNSSGTSRSRPSVPVNPTGTPVNVFSQNQTFHWNTDHTDRTLKMGIDTPDPNLGIFSKTKKKTTEVIRELEKTLKKINEFKPEKKDACV